MKKVIIPLFFTCLGFSALAVAEPAGQAEDFKQKLIAHVEGEIALLNQFKTCIQAAKARPDIEACNNAKNETQKKRMIEKIVAGANKDQADLAKRYDQKQKALKLSECR